MANINRLKSQQIDFNNNEFTIDGEKDFRKKHFLSLDQTETIHLFFMKMHPKSEKCII
jgi:hypothetical protein